MTVATFYHIYISSKPDVAASDVQAKMNLAIDWFRYDPKNWIVYTTSNANKWQLRLRPLADPGGQLFICRLDISDRQGWMNPEFWKWLNEDRS